MKKIKNYLRKKSDQGVMPTLNELIEATKNYSYISFDIFDTLLKRNVGNPSDVFDLIQCGLEKEENFKEKRIAAEQIARRKSNREITLDDIYENYDAEEYLKNKLKSLELCIEQQCLTINPYIIDFYNYCIRYKNVYIISDMYLPSDFIANVLHNNGITGYRKLYVSSEYGKTKKDGTLFELYLKQNGIDPKNAIHIGDSWKADYIMPQKRKISALHIPRIIKNEDTVFYGDGINTNYLNSVINNNIKLETNLYYKFGYQKFGPFLWGYIRWIHKKLKEKGIKKVFFFSRDGYIMLKAFKLLYAKEDIEVHYLEVSRRSLRVPVLHFNHDFKTIMGMVSPSKIVSLISIFDCVGLDINDYESLLLKYGLNKKSSFDRKTIFDNTNLLNLYKELSTDIENKSNNEYNALISYLKQEHVSGKFGIVDIGWSGGMQRFLTETLNQLGINNEIHGYYVGVADYYTRNTNVLPDLDLNGYLFDFKNEKNAEDKRSSFVGLFESFFLEQDGSVMNYTIKQNRTIANRASYEYIIDGKKTKELKAIHMLQSGALDFIKDARQDFILSYLLHYNADELFQGLKETGQEPRKNDLMLFSDFRFFDEGETSKLANPQSLFYYMGHIQELKNDFLKSRWKTGFMKKLLGIKLPYQQLYLWLLQFK